MRGRGFGHPPGVGDARGTAGAEGESCHAPGAFPEIPPVTAIRPAFIAGRIALGFLDDVDSPDQGEVVTPAELRGAQFFAGTPAESHVIEALDVSDRPYIWDL